MSNSALATYICLNTEKTYVRPGPISRITIHHSAGVANDLSLYASIISQSNSGSWNYAIDVHGNIGLFIDEAYGAWTSNSQENDSRAVTIEVSNSEYGYPWKVSDASYFALINLCVDICYRNNIPELKYTGQLATSNLTRHDWFAATECPGEYLGQRFPDIANQVNQRLSKLKIRPSVAEATSLSRDTNTYTDDRAISLTTYDATVLGSTNNPTDLLNVEKINPYIITTTRRSRSLDYLKLRMNHVVGVLIEAGYLFDEMHRKQVYRNPNLRSQVSAASNAKMPFGLYSIVRAQTESEARQELEGLRNCIYQYPPSLGVWLKLELNSRIRINDSILEIYYKVLSELGLSNNCGIYATRSQLKNISWNKFYEKYSLWLDNHLTSVQNLGSAITPELFVSGVQIEVGR